MTVRPIPHLENAVSAAGVGAQDFEHDDNAGDGHGLAIEGGASNERIRVADRRTDGCDADARTERPAPAAAQPGIKRAVKVPDDDGMAGGTTGHGNRLEAVELEAAFLGGGPGEELLLGP